MTVVINGTNGITNDGGYTGDGVVFADTTPANTLVTTTGGNVGIGTSSPATKLQVSGGVTTEIRVVSSGNLTTGAASLLRFGGSDSSTAAYIGYGGAASQIDLWNTLNGSIVFGTSNAERARIDANGQLSIGKTQASESASTGTGYGFAAASVDPFFSVVNTNAAGGNACIYLNKRTTGSIQVFLTNNGSANTATVGSISHNGTSTAYNTSSDYRLKEDVQPMLGALAKVTALRPVTYKWKATGRQSEGFIAHELAEVVPDAVHGEKDAVDKDGNIAPQGIDTSFLVATLTAAIQEQQAIITALTARVAALEGK